MSRMSHADVVVVVTAAGSKAARDREAGAKKRRGDPLFCYRAGARDTNGCYGGLGPRGVLVERGWAVKN